MALGKNAPHFSDFKERSYQMSEAEYRQKYVQTYGILERQTDLNRSCINRILKDPCGTQVLDAACGNGYLAAKLARQGQHVTGYDIQIGATQRAQYPDVTFAEGKLEDMPFGNNTYDVVVCTHALEHVRDLPAALAELRRVTRRKLIVVVPKQRPYRYTFDLHLHFFPYAWSVVYAFMPKKCQYALECVDGDWYYTELYE
jgi:ubiquinone/menaquinone biosynthesis C-methylase UbiE